METQRPLDSARAAAGASLLPSDTRISTPQRRFLLLYVPASSLTIPKREEFRLIIPMCSAIYRKTHFAATPETWMMGIWCVAAAARETRGA